MRKSLQSHLKIIFYENRMDIEITQMNMLPQACHADHMSSYRTYQASAERKFNLTFSSWSITLIYVIQD